MKSDNKSKTFPLIAAAALLLLQAVSTTACADYKGYWLDAVRDYQVSHPRDYQPAAPADYQDYRQEPVYVEPPLYQEPAPQYNGNYGNPAPQANRPLIVGQASYYAQQYEGRPTASGETYNMRDMTAAHRDLPFGTPIRVTNLQNGRSVVVRVNDRGPFKPGRVVDVSLAAAEQLGLILHGSAEVQVEVLG